MVTFKTDAQLCITFSILMFGVTVVRVNTSYAILSNTYALWRQETSLGLHVLMYKLTLQYLKANSVALQM
jgi:hypothetical protein